MRPFRVHIDVTNGTMMPAQPDSQTIYLNAARQQKTAPPQNAAPQPQASQQQETATPQATPHVASRALLLQATDIPAETARLVHCHNPWPSEDVYFCPEDSLPAFVTGVPALSSGSELWIAIHITAQSFFACTQGRISASSRSSPSPMPHPRPPNLDLCINHPYRSISLRSSTSS